jgi:hypothetical protein
MAKILLSPVRPALRPASQARHAPRKEQEQIGSTLRGLVVQVRTQRWR